jgi:ribosomal protein S27E
MANREQREWLCVDCGHVLGHMEGGELRPAVDGRYTITRGPNLVVECPECGFKKVFYTADPMVRALYQLVDSMSAVAAKRMVETIGRRTIEK